MIKNLYLPTLSEQYARTTKVIYGLAPSWALTNTTNPPAFSHTIRPTIPDTVLHIPLYGALKKTTKALFGLEHILVASTTSILNIPYIGDTNTLQNKGKALAVLL